MSLLRKLFKREKKEEKEVKEKAVKEKSLLEELCGEDKELYDTLKWVNLDPRGKNARDYEERARKFIKEGNLINARIEYWTAGSLYLYDGNAKAAMKCFSKCSELHSKIFGENSKHPAFEYLKTEEGVMKAIPVLRAYMEKAFRKEEKAKEKS